MEAQSTSGCTCTGQGKVLFVIVLCKNYSFFYLQGVCGQAYPHSCASETSMLLHLPPLQSFPFVAHRTTIKICAQILRPFAKFAKIGTCNYMYMQSICSFHHSGVKIMYLHVLFGAREGYGKLSSRDGEFIHVLWFYIYV